MSSTDTTAADIQLTALERLGVRGAYADCTADTTASAIFVPYLYAPDRTAVVITAPRSVFRSPEHHEGWTAWTTGGSLPARRLYRATGPATARNCAADSAACAAAIAQWPDLERWTNTP